MPEHTTPVTRRVSFETDDGVQIVASYSEPIAARETPRVPMVILLPGFDSDRDSYAPLIGPLIDAGFAALAIDFRGHGESIAPAGMKLAERLRDRDPKLLAQMHRDVMAGYLWLRDRDETDPSRLALVGAGLGFSVVLDAAAHDRSVDAVVGLMPVADAPGLDASANLPTYGNRPMMLVVRDTGRVAAERMAASTSRATVEILSNPPVWQPGQPRATWMLSQDRRIERRIVAFLVKALGPPSDVCVVASIKGRVYYEPDSSAARRLSPRNLRWFSSPTEAEARGLRPSRSRRK